MKTLKNHGFPLFWSPGRSWKRLEASESRLGAVLERLGGVLMRLGVVWEAT